jgi:hypothetical protein
MEDLVPLLLIAFKSYGRVAFQFDDLMNTYQKRTRHIFAPEPSPTDWNPQPAAATATASA